MSTSYNYFHYFKIDKNYVLDKDRSLTDYINYMLDRTNTMFKYENLPDTIPQRMLELYLQTNGNCFVTEVEGKLYAFTGTKGGYPDVYYQPTTYIVSNPALNFSKELKIDEDGVLFRNDSNEIGLLPMMNRYCSLFVENIISFRSASINSRIATVLSAGDDKTKKSAEHFIEDIVDGKLAVIGENPFLDGVKSHSVTPQGGSLITQLTELHQYLQAMLFNELGLDANYNMKKTHINATEADLNNDFLLPFVDDMYNRRIEAVNKINELYGTNIEVEFASTWKTNQMENYKEQMIYATPPEEGETPEDVSNEVTDGHRYDMKNPMERTEEQILEAEGKEVESDEQENEQPEESKDQQPEESENEQPEESKVEPDGTGNDNEEENNDKEENDNEEGNEVEETSSPDDKEVEVNINVEVQEEQDKTLDGKTGDDTGTDTETKDDEKETDESRKEKE